MGRDFQRRSRLRRTFLRALRAGENQGLDLGDWMVLVMSGACLLRIFASICNSRRDRIGLEEEK